jgi:hypothetical protein
MSGWTDTIGIGFALIRVCLACLDGYRGTARMYIWLLIKVRQKQC